jgi:glycosyltransferase involved in cell wall biosynthesis
MRDVLISIIMPVFNEERFLKTTFNSIIQQSYENFELIAVDDFSDDGSLLLMQEMADEDPRIRVVANTKKGIINALQLGFKMSQGDFITRMDADDIMVHNKLKAMLEKLKLHGSGNLAIGQVSYFSDTKAINEGYKNYEKWLNGLTEKGKNFDAIYTECPIPSPAWMLHRSDFIKCGGFLKDIYPEDYDLAFRMMEAGFKVIPEKEVLHLWRDHEKRASRNDSNYANNTFIPLKVHYFLKLHRKRRVAIWGAGKKGKQIVQEFLKRDITPSWYCNNEKKIGKSIYDIKLYSENELFQNKEKHQIIVAVSNPDEKIKIKKVLEQQGLINLQDFFFFT